MLEALEVFATTIQSKFSAIAAGREEDQLRRPVDALLEKIGRSRNLDVVAKDESTLDDQLGRPDFAVTVNRLLCGYIELKSPGTGVAPDRFKGHNKKQWERFRLLPNLIYTDGNQWALFRYGERIRHARFDDDLTVIGAHAVNNKIAAELHVLLADFFQWEPIVPNSAKQLAELLAPLCRMLHDDVLSALNKRSEAMQSVARDWRRYLFPEASDQVFADSYAQTVVFALLLARSDGSNTLLLDRAIQQLTGSNSLLSRALEVLTDSQLSDDIGSSLSLLQRIIQAVPTGTMSRGRRDPWLHFYEDFLAEYDPKLRKDVGAYYTPVEVVQAQVRLVDELLREKFHKRLGFADGDVATLDPAVGTGTYLLGIVEHALKRVRSEEGEGAIIGRAESVAKQLYGFEIMVGPYSVSALRLTRMFHDYGAKVPRQGVGICLSNTLESPHERIPELPLLYKPIGDEHKRARSIKDIQPVLVCIGNPPYDRHEAADEENRMMTGAWVRWGESKHGKDAILNDFIEPVKRAGKGGQLKNLYNLYVYFWRWALWKAFEHEHPGVAPGPGIVTFITASSYLDGDAFLGMREHMRRLCDEIWIIDLGGEGRGTRNDENVFNIQTPVAVAIAVRYGVPNPNMSARVYYCRIEGRRAAKLEKLESIEGFKNLRFETCPAEWWSPFRPQPIVAFFDWPQLTDLMPWQTSGAQIKRSWPLGPTREVLEVRWTTLLNSLNRAVAFKETRDRKISSVIKDEITGENLPTIADLSSREQVPAIRPYGYRSFDRQWLTADPRLADYPRPSLWDSQSPMQLYFTSSLTEPLGEGPALTLSANVVDMHHFSGRGAKDILPLYRDAQAQQPNLHPALITSLQQTFGTIIGTEDIAAYVYAVLAHPGYSACFYDELENCDVRVPVTLDKGLFAAAVAIGRRLIYLHSYGERFAQAQTWLRGRARCTNAIATESLPEKFSYDEATQTLHVGDGLFKPVAPEVWEFEVSGLKVVQSWLGYRMKNRKGKKSSPLDDITPSNWPPEFTSELLRLLHLLEETLEIYPEQEALLKQIIMGPLLNADQLGAPPEEYRRPVAFHGKQRPLEI
ncbi:type ISP restriction/modification enzyme [Nitrosospira briensis]|uniref:type ISP restriction/modification enzyme n=1 Tax=Nitrosospira briensis TaxID=35799 RepID=UPI000945630E|nr:type ISP restriction/modification enzyme [Nitrosospira briensis]